MEKKENKGFTKGLIIGILVTFAICLAITVIIVVAAFKVGGKDNAKMSMIKAIISRYYYQDVEEAALEEGVYKGVVEALGDPYSEYMTKEEYAKELEENRGEFAGIGALLSMNQETNVITITKVYKDSPAQKAGVKAEDILVSANGTTFNDVGDFTEFIDDYVKGEKGSKVVLGLIRDGKAIELTAIRDIIKVESVEHQVLSGNVGYIVIDSFIDTTDEDFEEAVKDLKAQNVKGLIIDLRTNGGGLVDSAVNVADYILPKGNVVYLMDKNGKRQDFNSDSSCLDMPIVVLTTGYTASASEILTGALKDYGYATVIGTKTYGKGIVQSIIPLTDGSAIKLTTESYYTPKGTCIHGVGIEPDEELELDLIDENKEYSLDNDNQVARAIEILTK